MENYESEYARGQRLLKEHRDNQAESKHYKDFLDKQDPALVKHYREGGFDMRETSDMIVRLTERQLKKAQEKLNQTERTQPLVDKTE